MQESSDTDQQAQDEQRDVGQKVKECHAFGSLTALSSDADQNLTSPLHQVFSSVNIEDSRHMQRLTEAAVRDSAAMKQISYLTMVFLPASFAAVR